jgi:hypothetical protein
MKNEIDCHRLRTVLFSLCVGFVLLSAAAPARADIVYTVDTGFTGTGLVGTAIIAGNITTDGTVGILEPQNILDWHLHISIVSRTNVLISSVDFGEDGGLLEFTPNSLSATTTTLLFNTLNLTADLSFTGDCDSCRWFFDSNPFPPPQERSLATCCRYMVAPWIPTRSLRLRKSSRVPSPALACPA